MNNIITNLIVDPNIQQGFTGYSLAFLQDANKAILGGLAQTAIGKTYDNTKAYVLNGLDAYGTNQYHIGFVFFQNEVFYCPGKTTTTPFVHSAYLNINVFSDPGSDPCPFSDGTARNVHFVRLLALTDATSGDILLSDAIYVQNIGPQTKRIAIGNWNMDTTATLNVAHGLSDISKIMSASIMIISDTSAVVTELTSNVDNGDVAGGNYLIDATQFQLSRITGGIYDGVGYDSSPFNRGYITVQYLL